MKQAAEDGRAGLPEDVLAAIDEPGRLALLRRLDLSEVGVDADLDRLARLGATCLAMPVGLVSIVESERQWFPARYGVEDEATSVSISFCAHAIAAPEGDAFVIEDLSKDPRFASNPLVSGERHVRFYAGAPVTVDGERIGTLCVLDYEPHPGLSPERLAILVDLADIASSLFRLKEDHRRGARAEAALARAEMRHALALDAGKIASWVWDVRNGAIECDELLPTLYGLDPASRVASRDIFARIDPRDSRQTELRLAEAFEVEDEYSDEYRIRGSAPTRWLSTRGRVAERDADGRASIILGVTFDISEHKLAQERQRNLLRELNHRVKNTLATVQAMATQTVRHAASPGDFLPAFAGRLQALGAAHGLLSDLEWRGITLGELVDKQVRPFVQHGDPRIVASGERVLLSPDQALALGLILHELGSNATRHGALSVPEGGVDLSWRVDGDGPQRLTIAWREHGGPRVRQPARRGFGSILIQRSLAKILTSRVLHEYRPEGVYAEIALDIDGEAGN